MRPRWRKVFTDLWSNKTRSLLVIASITIGLFAVGLIVSMYIILTSDMPVSYSKTNPANIEFALSDFNTELADQVAKLDQVATAMGQRDFNAQILSGDGEWLSINFHAIQDLGNQNLNRLTREKGIFPPQDKQMVVDIFKYSQLNLPLGQPATIRLASTRTRQVDLVGTVHDVTIGAFSVGGGFFLAPTQAYITLDSLVWFEQPPAMNRLMVRAADPAADSASLQALAQQIGDYLKKSGLIVYNFSVRPTNSHPNEVYVQAIAKILLMLGVLVMFLSAFLITNTLSALLGQQTQQIGILKTIGARRGQIILIYMLLILVYSAIALAIAIPLASRISYLFLEFLAAQINVVLQGYRTIPVAIWVQIALALVVPQMAALGPILHGTRISPVEAFNGLNASETASIKRPVVRSRAGLQISRPFLVAVRNTFRRKGRLALTLFTLTLGGAIFIATFNVRGSMEHYINQIGRYFLSDVNITLDRYERTNAINSVLLQSPKVKTVEGWSVTAGQLELADGTEVERFSLIAPPDGSPLVEPMLLEGRWVGGAQAVPGQNEIAVNERFRELYPNLRLGDSINVKINGDQTSLVVVGFFQMAGKASGFVAYSTYEILSGLIHQEGRSNSFRVVANRPGMNSAEQKALGKELQTLLENNGYQVAEIESGLSLTDASSDGLTILTSFLMIMSVMIAIVGGIGLAGALSMNVLERTREIGIMRSIGANNRILTRLVMVEGLIIGMISWFFGVLLAFPISIALSNTINLALFGASVEFTFTYTGILLWLALVIILSTLASVMPARNAARLTIREVLAYE